MENSEILDFGQIKIVIDENTKKHYQEWEDKQEKGPLTKELIKRNAEYILENNKDPENLEYLLYEHGTFSLEGGEREKFEDEIKSFVRKFGETADPKGAPDSDAIHCTLWEESPGEGDFEELAVCNDGDLKWEQNNFDPYFTSCSDPLRELKGNEITDALIYRIHLMTERITSESEKELDRDNIRKIVLDNAEKDLSLKTRNLLKGCTFSLGKKERKSYMEDIRRLRVNADPKWDGLDRFTDAELFFWWYNIRMCKEIAEEITVLIGNNKKLKCANSWLIPDGKGTFTTQWEQYGMTCTDHWSEISHGNLMEIRRLLEKKANRRH